MAVYTFLDYLPLWAFFVGMVAIVLLSIELGYWFGRIRQRGAENEKEAPVGAIVGATLGLLAFILAFTFGLAASRFDARRQTVVEEANAVGTTFLRAGMLPENRGSKIRELLKQYVEARLDAAQGGDIQQILKLSSNLQLQLWQEAESAGQRYSDSIVVGLFIQSLNEMIDVHSKRVLVGLQSRLPGTLWATLILITVLTMAGIGYQMGLSKSKRTPAILVLALTFSSILTLVADIDRPLDGYLTVSQRAMIDLRTMIAEYP